MFSVTIPSKQPYLTVTATGPAGLAELSGLAAFVAELVKSQGHTRLLADLSGVQPTMSFTDHLRFGTLIWELLGGLEKLAAVVPEDYLDAPAARAAKLAGMPVKTFLQMSDARSWMAGVSQEQVLARDDGAAPLREA